MGLPRDKHVAAFFAATLALLLSGCASSGGPHVDAANAALAEGAATLELNAKPSGGARFYVAGIDGPKDRQELTLSPLGRFHRLQPGLNSITVKTYFHDHFSAVADPAADTGILFLYAEASVAYVLNGFDDGKTLTLSITERNTLKPVTPELQVPISTPPPAPRPPVVIPIPLPVPLP